MADDQEERSETKAREAAQRFSNEQKNPLAANAEANVQAKANLLSENGASDGRPNGITFAAQDSLPKLPIPELDSTCERYLAALIPLQTSQEHADSEKAVQEFLRSEGPEMQQKLKEYSREKGSYIEQFCRWHPALLNHSSLTRRRGD